MHIKQSTHATFTSHGIDYHIFEWIFDCFLSFLLKQILSLQNCKDSSSCSESSSLVSDHCLQLWNDFYINTNNAFTYKQFYARIANVPIQRTHSSMFFRLRTGHCRLYYHLHRIGLHPNGLCDECNSAKTVEHFLIYCEQYTSARTKLRQSMQKLKIRFHWMQILRDDKANPFIIAYIKQTDRKL